MDAATDKPTIVTKVAAALCITPIVNSLFLAILKVVGVGGSFWLMFNPLRGLVFIGFPLSLWCLFVKKEKPWWLITASALGAFPFLAGLLLLIWIVFSEDLIKK